MRYYYKSFIWICFLVLVAGCAGPAKMVNTSPVKDIPVVDSFEAIPAAVLVRAEDPKNHLPNDVTNALQQHGVFTKVVSAVAGGTSGDLEMIVDSTTKSHHHVASGMGKAALSGLTLGLASTGQIDPFDYSVTIKARLMRGNVLIKEYETVGSYHSEVPEMSSMAVKTQRVKTCVKLSYDHALALLASQLKQDRAKILTSLK